MTVPGKRNDAVEDRSSTDEDQTGDRGTKEENLSPDARSLELRPCVEE